MLISKKEAYSKKGHLNTSLDIMMMIALDIMFKVSSNDWIC